MKKGGWKILAGVIGTQQLQASLQNNQQKRQKKRARKGGYKWGEKGGEKKEEEQKTRKGGNKQEMTNFNTMHSILPGPETRKEKGERRKR